ncbi:helix-turn-helix domain-containing protein [Caldimonas caldifontis]|uniref:DNA-binding protein n=1 Tax=Caldimonas caldifontis TaxID=1452508 RepID=A0A2S5SV67_9BURK|nr:helix-turn-helix domain-containing protein [Caldimonas caldifontis]PPE66568.1 DNA-binding protein [Caldimonas caldifontis]
MNDTPLHQVLGERLIDAREAALTLNLPLYWLTHAKERRRLGLPHYRVGKLLRFKLSELIAWMEESQALHTADAVHEEEADAGLQ